MPWIGPNLCSNLLYVRPKYPLSKVLKHNKFYPMESEVHKKFPPPKSTCTSEDTEDKKSMWMCHVSLSHTCTLYALHSSEVYVSQMNIYFRSNWLAPTHPRHPRLTCIKSKSFRFDAFISGRANNGGNTINP